MLAWGCAPCEGWFVTSPDSTAAEFSNTAAKESISNEDTGTGAAAATAVAADTANGSGAAARGSAPSNPVERFLGWAGKTIAQGARGEEAPSYTLAQEPLPFGTEVDWERALELCMRRRDSERERLDRIEGKIAPIIAGTIAGLGLFVDKAASAFDYLAGALLLVPLAMLFLAFRTYEYIDTPSLDELVRTYERWPRTYMRSVVVGTAEAVSKNGPVIDRKARELNRTMGVLFAVVVIIIASRTFEAMNHEQQRSNPAGTRSSAASPTAHPVNRPSHRHEGGARLKPGENPPCPAVDRRNEGTTAQVGFMFAPPFRLRHLSRVFAFCAGALLFGLPAAGAAADAPAAAADDAANGYVRGQELFHEKKFREAIAAVDAYLAAHPRDARALVLRGDAKADLGQHAEALKDYNSAIKINPEYQYAYVTRCETRLQLDDVSGALADCDNAVRLDATDPLAFEDRGDVHFQREAWALALADYDKAVELGRSNAYLFAARCDSERLVGKRDRAKVDCEKALALDPKSRRGLWARGRLALVEGRYTDGIADLNAYIAQNPKSSDTAYYFRGLAYNRISSYRQALEDLRTYVQRQPSDPDGYKERAVASYGLGDKDGALADLDVALRGYRKNSDTVQADRVGAMMKAIAAGKQPVP